ncbi:MAG: hydantoinase/oxoprolinase family protein [Ardenticatenaceae bacterium]|nr:hydantoinase/oxoprolinase family protein [Ardenticatenaceae bacterium]
MYRVGIDIGGTFTDFVVITPDNRYLVSKVPSTPPNFGDAIFEGLEKLRVPLEETSLLVHGTTVATNCILERKGAKTALITTKGFRDVIALGRGSRRNNFNFWWHPPEPLVRRSHVFEVKERLDYRGKVLTPLDEEELSGLIEQVRSMGFEAVAISYLFSPINPAHEAKTQEQLAAAMPGIYISTASEINPEILEYERASTAVANAYVGPVLKAYIDRLSEQLRARNFRREMLIVTSAGGVLPTPAAAKLPAATVLSGLAGGVAAGRAISLECGYPNCVSFDIGGTSTDVSLVHQGNIRMTTSWELAFGIPIRLPAVDVHTIGAGGGSIAWVDAGGALRVGPQSAGAVPGPASYGQGGRDATLTDAHLVLGRLNSARWEALYGRPLEKGLAEEAIHRVGAKVGLDIIDCAAGIVSIANSQLLAAIRLMSIERGYNPREFALVAFGGAGGLHAVDLGRALGASTVLIPPVPGVTSALGLLTVDIRHDLARALLITEKELDPARLRETYYQLIEEGNALLESEGVPPEQREIQLFADVRYFGRSNSLMIPVSEASITKEGIAGLIATFNATFKREFGYLMPEGVSEIEIVNARAVVIGKIKEKAQLSAFAPRLAAPPRPVDQRAVYFANGVGWVKTNIYRREDLGQGVVVNGPAIIEQPDTTTVLPPGVGARVDQTGTLTVSLG